MKRRKTFAERLEETLPLVPIVLTPEQITEIAAQIEPTDISGKVDKVTGKSLVADIEIVKIHSNTNDLSSEQKTALTGGGEINLHSHAGGGGLSQQQIEGLI